MNADITIDREQLLKQLKNDWQQLLAKIAEDDARRDELRAELMNRYYQKGLTTREIGDPVGLSISHVGALLRYHRFILHCQPADRTLARAKVTMSLREKQFRRYWRQVADRQKTFGQKVDLSYEAECFDAIWEMLEKGIQPMQPKKKSRLPTADKIHTIADMKKVARQIYDDCKPTLTRLKRLLKADRSTYTPSLLAEAARIVDEKIEGLFQLLDNVSEEQEPKDTP